MSIISEKMGIFRDRMTAHRYMLTENNLSTKAFDEAISALHDAMGQLSGNASQASAMARATLPAPVPSKLLRQHATFKPSAPREPCGRREPLPLADNWPEPTPPDQDNFDGRFTDAAPGDTTY